MLKRKIEGEREKSDLHCCVITSFVSDELKKFALTEKNLKDKDTHAEKIALPCKT